MAEQHLNNIKEFLETNNIEIHNDLYIKALKTLATFNLDNG